LVNRDFYDWIIPIAMWRRFIFANVNMPIVYFKPARKEIHIYDCDLKEKQFQKTEMEIPIGSRTISVDKTTVYLIGGTYPGENKNLKNTCEYHIKNKIMNPRE